LKGVRKVEFLAFFGISKHGKAVRQYWVSEMKNFSNKSCLFWDSWKKNSYPLLGLGHCFASKRQVDITKVKRCCSSHLNGLGQRMFFLNKVSADWHSNKITKKSLTTIKVRHSITKKLWKFQGENASGSREMHVQSFNLEFLKTLLSTRSRLLPRRVTYLAIFLPIYLSYFTTRRKPGIPKNRSNMREKTIQTERRNEEKKRMCVYVYVCMSMSISAEFPSPNSKKNSYVFDSPINSFIKEYRLNFRILT